MISGAHFLFWFERIERAVLKLKMGGTALD